MRVCLCLKTPYLVLQMLKQVQLWESLHCMPTGQPAPCTAMAVGSEGGGGRSVGGVSLVTGGEDGRITVLRTDDPTPLHIIGELNTDIN